MSFADVDPDNRLSEFAAADSVLDRGVWSHGDCLLVDRRSYSFPDRCLICNVPAEGRTYGLRLPWLPEAARGVAAAFHLFGPLAHLLVMLLFTRWATLRVPYCRRHVWRRRRSLLFGWLSFPAALVLIGICIDHRFSQLWLIILIGLAGTAGTLYGYYTYCSPKAVRIERQFVLIKHIATGFLVNVPRAPTSDAA